ncbi:hypothetical protein J3R30DRAFT_3553591 [Lentinula aciculospora]|uniref:Uncharacterized protein n=1 Tax=Lentinula aciculospora TaxID=153920 RepID=A0A9W8ZWQ7_9AGAR|nr:hypothetical protein J3R30DRAFT_3553591 [Lentinula aciculospora]
MFKFVALFALLNAVLVSSIALTPRAPAAVAHKGIFSDVADAILVFTTCNQVNLVNCLTWTSTTLPVGCTSLIANGQGDLVESAATPSGIECTLFTGEACSGSAQLINGTVDDLSVVGFSKIANSFTCQSN